MLWHLSDIATWLTPRICFDVSFTSVYCLSIFSIPTILYFHLLQKTSLVSFLNLTGVKMNQLCSYCQNLLDNTMPYDILSMAYHYQLIFIFGHIFHIETWLTQRHVFWCEDHLCTTNLQCLQYYFSIWLLKMNQLCILLPKAQ